MKPNVNLGVGIRKPCKQRGPRRERVDNEKHYSLKRWSIHLKLGKKKQSEKLVGN